MTAKSATREAKQAVEHVDDNPAVEALARLGYIMRGVLYITIGLIAAGVAFGSRSAPKDPTGAIAELGAQPYGRILLMLMALGLAGYSMWGFIRAIWDPLNRGTKLRGLIERAGFIGSGITYGVLVFPALQFLSGKPAKGQTQTTQDLTAQLLHASYGKWAVIAIGIFFLIVAAAQFYTALKADFKKDLRPTGLSRSQIDLAIKIGQYGHAARGIVFSLLGLFMVQAAMTYDPQKAQGLDGALAKIAQQPYGLVLLAIVALGLMAFGVYSLVAARWNKV